MWTTTKTTKYGVAVYNWRGDTRYGLPLEIGETVQILEECTGWYRGFSTKNRAVKGIFPSSYVHLKPCKIENEGLFESVIPLEDPVVREVTLVLREWGGIWKRLYVERVNYKFDTLRKVMRELLEWRRQLLAGTLTTDQTRELKLRIINKVDWGNRKLGLDLVPRQGAHMVDPETMSIVELYHVHVQSAENSQGSSARGTLRRKEHRKVLTHHLYFCMRDFGHSIGEDTEIYFSLYDAKRNQYLSERFLVRISKEGFSSFIEKIHSNCTIFTDLGNADLSRDLYMVAHVMRCGRMLYSDSGKNKAGTATYRRPHGVAVLSLAEATQDHTEELEMTFKVCQGEEKEFYQLHEQIIRNNKCSPLPGQPNYGIVVSLRVLHGELTQVREENPLLFKNICLTKKLGFSDVIMPGDVRNDLYLKLERGEFERGGKSTGKNIEVTILVLDADGQPLEECLFGAAGMEGSSEYQSLVIYHHNSPSWAETVRLAIPIDKFYGSHVRFEFRHCSTREKNDKKLFSFAFVRLMEPGGATLQDGPHELYIYKCEDRSKLDSLSYLSLPSSAREPNATGSPAFSRSPKEAVFVQTLLCSTKLTQNVDLLSLLQWKAHPERISEALGRVLRLDGEELVKFLQDILDALFSMFHTEDGNSTAHSGLVFQVLVSIFSLLEDSKFEHFKPVMDAYISGHFAAALVYKGLLSSVQHCADWVTAAEKQEPIIKCFRSLEYIFKFIIQSRLLFARATAGQYEDSFKRDLYCVFAALNKMLGIPYEMVLHSQIALLYSISAVFEQLVAVLPVLEVAKLACTMLDSVPREPPLQLTQAKLTAIKNLTTSLLFREDNESRNLLLVTMCRHLRIHLVRREELRSCTEILGEILSFLYKRGRDTNKVNNCIQHDVETLCLSILDVLIQTILIVINTSGPVLGCLVACLIGLLQLLDEYHYVRLWEELAHTGERKPLKDFLLRVFLVLRDLVRQEVFPPDWLVIRMQANSIILKSLQELAQPLASQASFDSQLWSTYFNLAVAYLTQPSLQLEQFSEVKREKIIEKYRDMRVFMGFQILSMWNHLGDRKLEFIPGMVGPFLEVTLVPESELRKATLHIFFDMMECEQRARGSFKSVESELIDKLDILISENKGDDEYRQLFNTMEHLSAVLLDRVQSEDPTWKDSGTAFITSITRLLERLLDYRSVIQGDENRDKRMSCTVNLLNFYKNEFNRKEMYLRYIYKLHDLHLVAENYTEAGFTMKLYADQLGWGSTILPADHLHPQQPEWQRKEVLYHKIIHDLDRGKCWEKGIPLCKELAVLYETRLYDYAKLSHLLKLQAKLLDNILTQLRPEPEYFRVGFYGLSFPLFVRNKLFIYRGLEYERIGAFTQRLQTEFPSAQILMKNSPPDESILISEGQYIQICNVKPIPEENSLACRGAEVPERVVAFYLVNDVRKFIFDRPLHRGPVDRENEFKSLWIERTTLTTEAKLPGILRWFEVIEKRSELLAPVQYACETMLSVERELRRLVAQYTAEPNRNINPFSMRLQGIIDANVMGGITKYQEAFLTPEFARQNPDMVPHVNRLKSLILDQMSVLEAGLNLHGQIAPAGVQPLHKRLNERFTQLKQGLGPLARQRTIHQDSIVNSPLPPLPVNEKQRPATLETAGCRISHADSDGLPEDEGFYTRVDGGPPPIPQREVRPRSVGYGTTPPRPTHQRSLSKPLSPKLPLRHSLPTPTDGVDQTGLRTSWSEPGPESAPPLPPRGCTPDKRDSNTNIVVPPAPPKRLAYKRNTEWSTDDDSEAQNEPNDLRDSGISTASLLDFQSHLTNLNNLGYEDFEPRARCNDIMNISPPSVINALNVSTGNFANVTFQGSHSLPGQEVSPPPIPPKAHQDTPSAPSTLERVSNRSQSHGHSENYSVPKLQTLSMASDTESTV
ncbi:dedicator of cytokinesis spg isoform X1 [Bombus vancouverensis nearcticus]|uniref:Dedicator of cytokinesis protein 3 isoform X1 n=3 Tax=Pyrobombus TaxID=144703 RepID=A0A6P8N1H3_9HYME|nr:dedicator of cytokinesis protein 3 isoform X1 [Bombus vancouverensis nearcticus]XP_033308505.1 dedicator of cytokinesis protein 3 isoform X1 [Bombus bifarius]XP_050485547.1 dedicator of cytokinesis protein 3 isoform X1 [Bombus huntii]